MMDMGGGEANSGPEMRELGGSGNIVQNGTYMLGSSGELGLILSGFVPCLFGSLVEMRRRSLSFW
jgi:hypothetical protein